MTDRIIPADLKPGDRVICTRAIDGLHAEGNEYSACYVGNAKPSNYIIHIMADDGEMIWVYAKNFTKVIPAWPPVEAEADAALTDHYDELKTRLRDGCNLQQWDGQQAAGAIERLQQRVQELEKTLRGCQWYWPADDTESENCASCPMEVIEAAYGWGTPTGEIVPVARGGIVEVTYCAALPPAPDADSDDVFWIEEATEEDAAAKIHAELDRRAALTKGQNDD